MNFCFSMATVAPVNFGGKDSDQDASDEVATPGAGRAGSFDEDADSCKLCHAP